MRGAILRLVLGAARISLDAQAVFAESVKVLMKTSMGDITLELDADKAPKSVENFVKYANDGFYNGTIFHRVIKGFMIQGGGYDGDMQRKPTQDPVSNEADNGLKNDRGTVAMARTMDPHSATAQFFINVSDNKVLDHPGQDGWGYCVFGKVVEGMDVVTKMKDVATSSRLGHQDVPVEDVVINSVTAS